MRARVVRESAEASNGVGVAARAVWRFAAESVPSTRAKHSVVQAAAKRYEPAGLCTSWRNICISMWHEYFRQPQLRLWLDGQLIATAQIPEPNGSIVQCLIGENLTGAIGPCIVFGSRLLDSHAELIALRGPGMATPWHAPAVPWSLHVPSRVYRVGLVRRYASESHDGAPPPLGPHGDGADLHSLLPAPAALQITATDTAAATATNIVEGASYGVSSVFSTVSSAFFGPSEGSLAVAPTRGVQAGSAGEAGGAGAAGSQGQGQGKGKGKAKGLQGRPRGSSAAGGATVIRASSSGSSEASGGAQGQAARRRASGRMGRPRALRRRPSDGLLDAGTLAGGDGGDGAVSLTPEQVEAAHMPPVVAALIPADTAWDSREALKERDTSESKTAAGGSTP